VDNYAHDPLVTYAPVQMSTAYQMLASMKSLWGQVRSGARGLRSGAMDSQPNLRLLSGVVWCGAVRCGVVWCGVVWCGAVRSGVVSCGVVRCGVVRCAVAWRGVPWVWRGVAWRGVAWRGVVGVAWRGVVWRVCALGAWEVHHSRGQTRDLFRGEGSEERNSSEKVDSPAVLPRWVEPGGVERDVTAAPYILSAPCMHTWDAFASVRMDRKVALSSAQSIHVAVSTVSCKYC
jgi:hypothetical protein